MNTATVDFGRGRRGVLVDTNLLLLLVVGRLDPRLIGKVERTSRFDVQDFESLTTELNNYETIYSTAHILTEVNSFLGQVGGGRGRELASAFAEVVSGLDELVRPAERLVRADEFLRFGLTHACIVAIAREGISVLSLDHRLTGFLRSEGMDVPVVVERQRGSGRARLVFLS